MLIIYLFLSVGCLIILIYLKSGKGKNKEAILSLVKTDKINQIMKRIYQPRDAINMSNQYCLKKLKLCLIIGSAGCLAAFFMELASLNTHELLDGERIERNEYGKGDRELWVIVTEEASKWQRKIKLLIKDQKYTPEEINELARKAENDIVKEIAGNNQSLEYVTDHLNLMTALNNYPFQIQWKTDSPLLLSKSGKLHTERICEAVQDKAGLPVQLTAELKYEDFTRQLNIPIRIFPKEDVDVQILDMIWAEIENNDKDTKYESYQRLPLKIGDRKVQYQEVKNHKSFYLFILGIATVVLIFSRYDSEIQKQANERSQEMIRDYPQIVNKYALYYSAGMTTRVIWKRLCTDYQKIYSKTKKKHYVYEEMILAEKQMSDGTSELAAYEKFAARCQLPCYRLFVNLIEQTLQKGKENMAVLLEKEAREAYVERRNRAKRLGEEAGTKLLAPMFMMLLIVLFMIAVPAFLSFRM